MDEKKLVVSVARCPEISEHLINKTKNQVAKSIGKVNQVKKAHQSDVTKKQVNGKSPQKLKKKLKPRWRLNLNALIGKYRLNKIKLKKTNLEKKSKQLIIKLVRMSNLQLNVRKMKQQDSAFPTEDNKRPSLMIHLVEEVNVLKPIQLPLTSSNTSIGKKRRKTKRSDVLENEFDSSKENINI